MNRNDFMKLMNLITLKLQSDVLFVPLHDVNDKAVEKLFASRADMSNNNGKAPAIVVSIR